MIEVFCVLMLGLTPALAPMGAPPAMLLGPGWSVELEGQRFQDEVTREIGTATIFEQAGEDFGTIGILAHSYLEGRKFTTLVEGNQIGLAWTNGRREWYQVTEIRVYLSTRPGIENATLVRKGDVLTEEQVYREIYSTPGRLILQTCVGMSGGFYFVIAERVTMGARLPAAGEERVSISVTRELEAFSE